jgi:phage gpG-like protein
MADELVIKFDLDGEKGARIRRAFKKMSGEALRSSLDEFGNYKVSRTVRAFVRGGISEPGGPPGTRSGMLRASVTYEVEGSLLSVGTNLVYGAKLQEGGDIRPKTAKALTVPISPEAEGKRARDFSDTFIIPSKSGDPDTVGIIGRRAAGGTFQGLFALRKRVHIEARPWLFWDDRDASKLLGILNQRWEAAG